MRRICFHPLITPRSILPPAITLEHAGQAKRFDMVPEPRRQTVAARVQQPLLRVGHAVAGGGWSRQGVLVLAMALRVTRSLRITAVKASFFGLPLARRAR